MSRWILLAALVAAPATARQHDSRQTDAVSQAWNRYATASSQDGTAAVQLQARVAWYTNHQVRVQHCDMYAKTARGTC